MAGLVGWVYVFWSSFSEYKEYTEHVSQLMVDQSKATRTAVLGEGDFADGEAVDEDVEEIAQAAEEQTATDEDIGEVVDEIEEERKDKIRAALLIDIPKEIDNPNYAITFIEPTETGVEIQVDGGGFAQKKSPFILPSLAIGPHTINFRYIDEEEVSQNLEENFIIIPRAPVWSEEQEQEFYSDESVMLAGTSLPRSDVIVLVSSTIVSEKVEADEEGMWSVSISPDKLDIGEHTAIAFVKKDGYASNFSEPLEFTVGEIEGASDDGATSNTSTAPSGSSTPWWDNKYMNEENYYIVIPVLGVIFILFVLFTALIAKLIKKKQNDAAGWVGDAASGEVKEEGAGKLSLREKFAKAGLAVPGGTAAPEVAQSEVRKAPNKEKEKKPESKKEKPAKKKNVEAEASPKKGKKAITKGKEKKKEKQPKEESPPGQEESTKLDKDKVYSKDEFMEEFKDGSRGGVSKESNKIKISLTSR